MSIFQPVKEPSHSFYHFKNISLRFCFPNVLNLLIKFEAFTKLDHCRLPGFVSHSQTTLWNKEKEFHDFPFYQKIFLEEDDQFSNFHVCIFCFFKRPCLHC